MMNRSRLLHTVLPAIVLLTCWTVACLLIIGIPKGPMHGGSDLGGWEALGFYVWENLDFSWVVPRIKFQNNIHFYPEGVSAVFHSWGIERDLFYGLFHKLFGIGPWLGLYLAISYALTLFGTFFLLKNRISPWFAVTLSVAATFVNAYGINKFPLHYGIAIYHWSLLSILVDQLLLRDLIKEHTLNCRLVLLRGFLLVASLGQELGYIAGLGLTSFVVHVFLALLFVALRRGKLSLGPIPSRAFLGSLGLAAAFICYFYLGPFVSILWEVKHMESPEIMAGGWWAHPMRFLAPLFDPLYGSIAGGWGDTPDGFAPNSPGWALLSLALGGLVFATVRREWSVLSLVILMFFFIQYHPGQSKILGMLPWFSYARMGSRLTVAYPMILCCVALAMHWNRKPSRSSFFAIAFFYLSFAAWAFKEIPFIYKTVVQTKAFEPLPREFVEHMEAVKNSPEEAVLDWPFCYTGGNGGGVCPHYGTLEAVWANRKYHHKKVVGTYFSRLRAKDYDYYTKYGLDALVKAQRDRCLTLPELNYLKSFYDYYSFAGMHLYATVLPQGCMSTFVTVFGPWTRKVEFPNMGAVHYWDQSESPLPDKEIGMTDQQFYHYRYLAVTSLKETQTHGIERIWLPKDKQKIYSFLIGRFAPEIKDRVRWYEGTTDRAQLGFHPYDIMILDAEEDVALAKQLPEGIRIIHAAELVSRQSSDAPL